MDGTPVGRRVFLGLLGAGAAGILWGAQAQEWLERHVGPYLAKDGTGLSGFLPIGRFRIYSVTGSMPHRDHDEYRLRIGGLVDQPLTLTYRDLRAMPPTVITRDFQCVTGWRVYSVRWKGVRLGDVLDRAGVRAGAKALRLTSFDGTYSESLTLKQARRDDVLVVYEMEGEPVSRAHGGPVRLLMAPMYGYKSIKWLDRIEVVDRVVPGFWEERGYDIDAWAGTSNGRSDAPTS